MRNLCNQETRKLEVERLYRIAQELRQLAKAYDAMAGGYIEPHSDDPKAKAMAAQGRSIIRDLVEEWV